MKVYLAGPIEICSEEEIFLWRNYVSSKVKSDIEIITPKYHLGSEAEIFEDTKLNVEVCDIVFAHLPKAINERRASYGTIFEISYKMIFTETYPKSNWLLKINSLDLFLTYILFLPPILQA